MKIILIRHARTKHSSNQYIGNDNKNFGLSKEGFDDARNLFLKLKRDRVIVNNVYSSKLKRAQMTAKLIFPNLRLNLEHRLNEIDKGFSKFLAEKKGLNRLTLSEWEKIYNQGDENDRLNFFYPSGISLSGYIKNIEIVLKEIIAKNLEKETIAIVGHNGSIKSIITFVLNGDKKIYHHLRIDYGAYSEVEIIENRMYLNFLNR